MSGKVSSFCSGGDCIDARLTPDGLVKVTSTRVPERHLLFTPEQWDAFVTEAKAGHLGDYGANDVNINLHGVTVQASADEWAAFIAGVKAGEFDLEALA